MGRDRMTLERRKDMSSSGRQGKVSALWPTDMTHVCAMWLTAPSPPNITVSSMWNYGVTNEAETKAIISNTFLIITFRRNNILTNAIILINVVTSKQPNVVSHSLSPLFSALNVNERGGRLSTFGKWMKKNLLHNEKHVIYKRVYFVSENDLNSYLVCCSQSLDIYNSVLTS